MTQKNPPLKVMVHADEPDPLVRQLQGAHGDISIAACNTYDGLGAMLEEFGPDAVYSIRFAGTAGFPAQALLGPAGPAWISVGGSGVDHLGRWDTDKTTVTNSAGVAAAMMAEYVFGSCLHFSLDVPGLDRDKQSHAWPGRLMQPLRGKTVLIVGLGHTGQAVAKLAKAFGMMVIGTRARPAPTEHVDHVDASNRLGELWGMADFVVVCVPLLADTRGLVDRRAFEAMKRGVVLVDVSRGGIVDGGALVDALTSGQLKGAALDVFETEPLPPDSPLWDLPNVLISPHCSSVFEGWEQASMQLFCDNLARWKSGAPLVNIVDPDRGY
jgi:phosphoglycerate dehydrogenase-like enzyme